MNCAMINNFYRKMLQ